MKRFVTLFFLLLVSCLGTLCGQVQGAGEARTRVHVETPRHGSKVELALAGAVSRELLLRMSGEVAGSPGLPGPARSGTPAATRRLFDHFARVGWQVRVVHGPTAPLSTVVACRLLLDGTEMKSAWTTVHSPSVSLNFPRIVSAADGPGEAAARRGALQLLENPARLPNGGLGRLRDEGVAALVLPSGALLRPPEEGRWPLPVIFVDGKDFRVLKRAAATGEAAGRVEIRVVRRRVMQRSLVARLPGRGDGGCVILVSALRDGSGLPSLSRTAAPTAVVAETARVLGLSRLAGELEPLPVDVIACVFATPLAARSWFASRGNEVRRAVLVLLPGPLGWGKGDPVLCLGEGTQGGARRVLDEFQGDPGFWKAWHAVPLERIENPLWWALAGLPDLRKRVALLCGAPSRTSFPLDGPPGSAKIRTRASSLYGSTADVFRKGVSPAPGDLESCTRAVLLSVLRASE